MSDVAIITSSSVEPPPIDDAMLADELASRGIITTMLAWDTGSVATTNATIGVVRSTWNYHLQLREFLEWTAHFAETNLLFNSLAAISWNCHKKYLSYLSRQGVSCVPTLYLDCLSTDKLQCVFDTTSWTTIVVKPVVALGADGLHRVEVGKQEQWHRAIAGTTGYSGLLIQPYLASVESDGEVSICFVDGKVSHAVRKIPASGEFRVHEKYGGRLERITPTPAVETFARYCLESSGFRTLYARADILFDSNGDPLLNELELIEPDLYLREAPDVVVRLASAIEERLLNLRPLSVAPHNCVKKV